MPNEAKPVRCPRCGCGHCPGQIIQQARGRTVRSHGCRNCGRRFRNVTREETPSLLSRAVALFYPSAAAAPGGGDPAVAPPPDKAPASRRGGRRPGAGRPSGQSSALHLAFLTKRFLASVPGLSAIVEKTVVDSPEYQEWLREQEALQAERELKN
jgi:hypothetical protein